MSVSLSPSRVVDLYNMGCRDAMSLFLPDNSVDAIVCDPPYGLAFMGKKWDYDVPGGGGHPVEKGVLAPCWPHKGAVMIDQAHWVRSLWKVQQAATKARSARFEHGESPDA